MENEAYIGYACVKLVQWVTLHNTYLYARPAFLQRDVVH